MNFGIIGTNKISDTFLKNASEVKDFKLNAVYSRSYEKGEEFGKKFGTFNIYTNLEEMARSKKIECIYIASPNSLHKDQAITFLKNGIHVFCEKPLASNEKEVRCMIEVAKFNKVMLMEGMINLYLPNFIKIKERLGDIGKIRGFFSSYCQYSSRYDAFKNGEVLNAFKLELSNGAVMDIGVYPISAMVNLFGVPNKISAHCFKLSSGVDGDGSIICEYDEMTATLMYSKISNSYMESEIRGENGVIILNSIHIPTKAKIIYRDGRIETIDCLQSHMPYSYELMEFIRLIKEKDFSKRDEYLNESLNKIMVLDEVRRQIGLVYKADKASL